MRKPWQRGKPTELNEPTVRGEYQRQGICGAEPQGADAPPNHDPVLPCSLPVGHPKAGGHRSPSGWAWPA